ncbi:DNA-binding protein [Luteipulveratus mongoliensis]|uniref:DNA-binding protein n=1 Tax=Luteipulveratus mongoliensis TaxID=571913 RepID=A0A0K1JNA4_9MICO|nr:DNA-binding protein [Luteipulveratus mongoliensis]AKU18186.1 DNA-binding protein [Luteipulveratus mongoliensis]
MSVKTLAVRLDNDLHGRLAILAKLSGISIIDAIRIAIEKEVEVMAANPAVAARAKDLQDEITRDADEQRAAIQALLATPTKAPSKPSTARKGTSS